MKSRKPFNGTSMSAGIGVVTAQRTFVAGDRRSAGPQTPAKSRTRATGMRSRVVMRERPGALEAAHYAGITVGRLIAVKEQTLGVSPGGRLVMTLGQVRERLRELLLMETGQDLDTIAEEGCFPAALNPTTRMGLQLPIQSTYFCEVKCRVGVKALRAATTPDKLVQAVWDAIPLAHRSATVCAEEPLEAAA